MRAPMTSPEKFSERAREARQHIETVQAIGDTQDRVDKLVGAVQELAREDRAIDIYAPTGILERRLAQGTYMMPAIPDLIVTPREAFLSDFVEVQFKRSAGSVCAEVVTPYPPGIPLLCPGERITQEIVDYLELELKAGIKIQGPVDAELKSIRVLKS